LILKNENEQNSCSADLVDLPENAEVRAESADVMFQRLRYDNVGFLNVDVEQVENEAEQGRTETIAEAANTSNDSLCHACQSQI